MRSRSNRVRLRRDSRARRSRIAKAGGVQFPKRREARYLAAIDERVTAAADLVVKLLAECLSQFESEPQEVEAGRADASAPDPAPPKLPNVVDLGIIDDTALLRMVDTARLGRARVPPKETDLLDVAKGVDTFSTEQVSKVVRTVVGIETPPAEDLERLQKEWVKANKVLITSIDTRFFDDVLADVREAVAKGRSTTQLAKDIARRTGVAKRRAQLIARDQIASLNAQVTKARQEAIGVARYEWSTSRDEVVRPEHRAREGVVFEWSNPPPDGHPGEPINCRCVALPVFEEIENVTEEEVIEEKTPPKKAAKLPPKKAPTKKKAPRKRAPKKTVETLQKELDEKRRALREATKDDVAKRSKETALRRKVARDEKKAATEALAKAKAKIPKTKAEKAAAREAKKRAAERAKIEDLREALDEKKQAVRESLRSTDHRQRARDRGARDRAAKALAKAEKTAARRMAKRLAVEEAKTPIGRVFGNEEAAFARIEEGKRVGVLKKRGRVASAARRTIRDEQAVAKAEKALRRVPAPLMKRLEAEGYEATVAPKITDVWKGLRGVQPRGWPTGSTWEQVGGGARGNRVVLASFEGRIGNTTLHETGHVVDNVLGKLSEGKAFDRLYRKHRGAITGWMRDTTGGDGGYFLMKAKRGAGKVGKQDTALAAKSEFFAEVFGRITRGERDRQLVELHFPGLIETMAGLIDDAL